MPTREPRPLVSTLRAHPRAVLSSVLVVLGVVLLAVLGGLARATPEGAVSVRPGAVVDAEPFRFRLDEARADYVLDGQDAEPGQAFVSVEGTLALTADVPVSSTTLGNAITADLTGAYSTYGTPVDEPEASVRVLGDGTSLLGLGPGLTYAVRITFVVDEAAVPELLTVSLLAHQRRPSALDGTLGWYDATPVARVALDVAPLPATRPEPEGF